MSSFRVGLCSLAFVCLAFALSGCDGDTGLTGRQGDKGEKGEDGIDPETSMLPAPRYVMIGVVNGDLNAVVATAPVYVTFDTSARVGSDTIVANRVTVPPLLDGKDGGVQEWGSHKSVLRLTPRLLDSNSGQILDPRIYKITCRVAYDDEYLYTFLEWREATVVGSERPGTPTEIMAAAVNVQHHTLYIDISHPEVTAHTSTGKTTVDTIFTNLRIHPRIILDSVCFPPPPLPPVICDYDYDTTYETLLVWRTLSGGEDRAAICWSTEESDAFDRFAECVIAPDSLALTDVATDGLCDLWRWGAATSEPVSTADDWSICSGRAAPDDGQAPFQTNWSLPDSIPRFMNRLDPNHITSRNSWDCNSPLWYYDAVHYTPEGWTRWSIVYVPGIVVTVPSRSRADVMVCSLFDIDCWVVEFKRARKTGNGDDLQF